MRTFKDTNGREWRVDLNVTVIRQIRQLTGCDLGNASLDGDVVETVMSNVERFADVLFASIKEQADAEDVTDVEFGRALNGDVISEALDVFLAELVDFFPETKRPVLRAVIDKIREAERAVMAAATKKVCDLDTTALVAQVMANESTSGE